MRPLQLRRHCGTRVLLRCQAGEFRGVLVSVVSGRIWLDTDDGDDVFIRCARDEEISVKTL